MLNLYYLHYADFACYTITQLQRIDHDNENKISFLRFHTNAEGVLRKSLKQEILSWQIFG